MKISNKIIYVFGFIANIFFYVVIASAFPDGDVQMAWLGALISGLGSVAGGVAGSIQAAKQRKELDKQQKELDQWYRGEMGTHYLDRADSRSMLKRIRDYYDERMRKQDTSNIKGGASEETKVAQAVAANKGIADATSRISAVGQQHKDNVDSQYRRLSYNIGMQKADLAGSGAQSLANSLASSGSVLGDIVGDLRGTNSIKKNVETMAQNARNSGNHGIPEQVTESILDTLDSRLYKR